MIVGFISHGNVVFPVEVTVVTVAGISGDVACFRGNSQVRTGRTTSQINVTEAVVSRHSGRHFAAVPESCAHHVPQFRARWLPSGRSGFFGSCDILNHPRLCALRLQVTETIPYGTTHYRRLGWGQQDGPGWQRRILQAQIHGEAANGVVTTGGASSESPTALSLGLGADDGTRAQSVDPPKPARKRRTKAEIALSASVSAAGSSTTVDMTDSPSPAPAGVRKPRRTRRTSPTADADVPLLIESISVPPSPPPSPRRRTTRKTNTTLASSRSADELGPVQRHLVDLVQSTAPETPGDSLPNVPPTENSVLAQGSGYFKQFDGPGEQVSTGDAGEGGSVGRLGSEEVSGEAERRASVLKDDVIELTDVGEAVEVVLPKGGIAMPATAGRDDRTGRRMGLDVAHPSGRSQYPVSDADYGTQGWPAPPQGGMRRGPRGQGSLDRKPWTGSGTRSGPGAGRLPSTRRLEQHDNAHPNVPPGSSPGRTPPPSRRRISVEKAGEIIRKARDLTRAARLHSSGEQPQNALSFDSGAADEGGLSLPWSPAQNPDALSPQSSPDMRPLADFAIDMPRAQPQLDADPPGESTGSNTGLDVNDRGMRGRGRSMPIGSRQSALSASMKTGIAPLISMSQGGGPSHTRPGSAAATSPFPSSVIPFDPLNPPRLDLYTLERDVSRPVLQRGVRVFLKSAVSSYTEHDDESISAQVAGTDPQPYSVKIRLPQTADDTFHPTCTCPYIETVCKHSVAVALSYIARRDRDLRRKLRDLRTTELRQSRGPPEHADALPPFPPLNDEDLVKDLKLPTLHMGLLILSPQLAVIMGMVPSEPSGKVNILKIPEEAMQVLPVDSPPRRFVEFLQSVPGLISGPAGGHRLPIGLEGQALDYVRHFFQLVDVQNGETLHFSDLTASARLRVEEMDNSDLVLSLLPSLPRSALLRSSSSGSAQAVEDEDESPGQDVLNFTFIRGTPSWILLPATSTFYRCNLDWVAEVGEGLPKMVARMDAQGQYTIRGAQVPQFLTKLWTKLRTSPQVEPMHSLNGAAPPEVITWEPKGILQLSEAPNNSYRDAPPNMVVQLGFRYRDLLVPSVALDEFKYMNSGTAAPGSADAEKQAKAIPTVEFQRFVRDGLNQTVWVRRLPSQEQQLRRLLRNLAPYRVSGDKFYFSNTEALEALRFLSQYGDTGGWQMEGLEALSYYKFHPEPIDMVAHVQVLEATFLVRFAASSPSEPKVALGLLRDLATKNMTFYKNPETGYFSYFPARTVIRITNLLGADLCELDDNSVAPVPRRLWQLVGMADALEAEGVVMHYDERAEKLITVLRGDRSNIPMPPLPTDLSVQLRDYQAHGVAWLRFLERFGMGGILADDMGLGKTVQTLTLLLAHYNDFPDSPPSLVIAPTSVVYNWLEEATKFTPTLRVATYIGADRHGMLHKFLPPASADAQDTDEVVTRRRSWKSEDGDQDEEETVQTEAELEEDAREEESWALQRAAEPEAEGGDVVGVVHGTTGRPQVLFTTYGVVRRDVAALQRHLWAYIIIDEAQAIKNPASATAHAVKALRGLHTLALSGTPIENRLLELYSIFDFLMPDYLARSQRQFIDLYEKPIATYNDPGARRQLQERVRPFILRRLKEEVEKALPPKTDIVLKSDLTPRQRALYDITRDQCRTQVLADIQAAGGVAAASLSILAALMKLRQICDDPRIVHPGASADNLDDSPDAPTDPFRINSVTSAEMYSDKDSTKLILLAELLQSITEEGHRVLIFSQFVSMLKILRKFLSSLGIKFEYIDGQVPAKERIARVNRFNEDSSYTVFLISLKAGGTGLNLTGADYVIHYDAWWNPAIEAQATDRAHRIGQTRPVFNYKMICRNTIEEKVLLMQTRKANLADQILSASDGDIVKSLTLMDVEYLFND